MCLFSLSFFQVPLALFLVALPLPVEHWLGWRRIRCLLLGRLLVAIQVGRWRRREGRVALRAVVVRR